MSAVAKRYARAAVEVAADKGGSGAVETLALGLRAFEATMAESAELREALRNPALEGQRQAVLAAIVQRLGLSEVAARVVTLLADNDRIAILADVARETEALADERLGRLRAFVATAVPLSDGQAQRLSRALEKRFAKPVMLAVEVDATLLGGLVCQVGDLTMDSSVRRQLETMRERLLA